MKYLFIVAVALTQCPQNTDTACKVIKDTLYPNCRFKLSEKEVSTLSQENLDKLTAVKTFFRSCPQAKACLTGRN